MFVHLYVIIYLLSFGDLPRCMNLAPLCFLAFICLFFVLGFYYDVVIKLESQTKLGLNEPIEVFHSPSIYLLFIFQNL